VGRQVWPYVVWCTGQSGAPPDSPVHHRTTTVAFGAWFPSIPGAADRWSSGPVGAPDTVQCTPDSPVCPTDRWREPCVARWSRGRPLAASAVDSPDILVHHWTVRWIIATSPFTFSKSNRFTVDQPGAPDSPVCQARAGVGCTLPTLLQFKSSFLGTVSST
jgi:hypothetical protein